MTEPLDWSDLSKLQPYGFEGEIEDVFGGNSKLVVIKKLSGYYDHAYCGLDGRDADGSPRVIPRPPAQPKTKTVRLCRPTFYVNTYHPWSIREGLSWELEPYWNKTMGLDPERYGPLEYKDFEVPE